MCLYWVHTWETNLILVLLLFFFPLKGTEKLREEGKNKKE